MVGCGWNSASGMSRPVVRFPASNFLPNRRPGAASPISSLIRSIRRSPASRASSTRASSSSMRPARATERRKRLAIMDQDGANVRYLTPGDNSVGDPALLPAQSGKSPSWPSRAVEQPRVQVLNIETGARQAVGNFPDMTSSPRFSPDGRSILMALQQGGKRQSLSDRPAFTRTTTRLTSTRRHPTPRRRFPPDGDRIVFESDRGRAPAALCNESRMVRTRSGFPSATAPIRSRFWSAARGILIAFPPGCRGGQFSIGVMRPDGSGRAHPDGRGYHNESPAWAPNGQYLVFFREPRGEGGGQLFMVDVTGRVETPMPDTEISLPIRPGRPRSVVPERTACAGRKPTRKASASLSRHDRGWPSGAFAGCPVREDHAPRHRSPSISSRVICHAHWSAPRRSRWRRATSPITKRYQQDPLDRSIS